MATPVFKFKNEFSEVEYFFIYNTGNECPVTKPMCLSNFLIYHLKSNRTFDGFIYCFKNIVNNGTSLTKSCYQTFFDEKEKKFYFENAEKDISFEVLRDSVVAMEFLINNLPTESELQNFVEIHLLSSIILFKGCEYYETLPSYDWALTKKINLFPDISIDNDDLPF